MAENKILEKEDLNKQSSINNTKAACSTLCDIVCQGTCQACEYICMSGCQTDCEVSCQLACEHCEIACQGGCQTGCQVYCQGPCEEVCQTTCQITCLSGQGPKPTFSASFTVQSPTSVSFFAEFKNGDSDYSRHRFVRISLNSNIIGDYYSNESSGGNNSFSGVITNLTPSTLYYWIVQLGYFNGPEDYQNPELASYSDQGMFETDAQGAQPYVYTTKNNITQWWPATAYIYTNDWKKAIISIYDEGWKS